MPATLAAPPSAPKTASPTKAPAPAAKPDTTPPEVDTSAFADTFSELDRLSAADQQSEAKPEGKIVEKPAPKPPDEEQQPAETETPEPKPEDKPAEKPEEQPKTNKELRHAYEELKKKTRVRQDEFDKLKAELQKVKSTPPPDEGERKVVVEKLTAAEKRVQELEQEIQFVNYAKSQEFTEKYQKPYVEAWQEALADLSEITIEQEDGTRRPAKADDLTLLAQLPLGEATEMAERLFGKAASAIMAHRGNIKRLAKLQEKALEDARGKGTEREKEQQVRMAQQREQAQKAWTENNSELETKYPQWFGHPEDDADGNQLYDKAREQIDRYLFARTEELPPDQAVRFHALIRAKFANHDRLALHLKTARQQIADLQKTVDEYEKSEPPAGATGKAAGSQKKSFMETIDAEIQALDQKI